MKPFENYDEAAAWVMLHAEGEVTVRVFDSYSETASRYTFSREALLQEADALISYSWI